MMPRYLNRSSRQERAAAEYSSAESADEYASAYQNSRAVGRFLRARLRLVQDVLAGCPGGDLLDAGCGPGIMAQALLKSRPDDFRISVMDQSWAMVEYCATSTRSPGTVYPAVGRLEALPYANATFDITLAMGVLEYADIYAALNELSRVTKPGGLVVTTMLNPLSPYQIIEWILYRPVFQVLGAVEICLQVPVERRHKTGTKGIHGFTPGKLRRLMTQADLEPVDLVYFDLTLPIPPFYGPSMEASEERKASERRTMARWSRWLCRGYLVAARPGFRN